MTNLPSDLPQTELMAVLKQNFADFEHSLSAKAQNPLHTLRRRAFELFEGKGFPTIKDEEWKYTSVADIIQGRLELYQSINHTSAVLPAELKSLVFEGLEANILVFINGVYTPNSSTIITPVHEMAVLSFAEAEAKRVEEFYEYFGKYADAEGDAFVALNTAFADNGTFIHVPAGKVVELPVVLLFICDSAQADVVCQPRNLYYLAENAQIQIIEVFSHSGTNKSFTNAVSEIVLAPNARADYYKIQKNEPQASHIGTTQVCLAEQARINSLTFTSSGATTRNNLNIVLAGKHAEANMYGLYLGQHQSHIDNHTLVDHQQPDCNSNELYKGILAQESVGVFNGKIFVRPDAQKTNAFQSNRNILLSQDAKAHTKPQLEIFADDVKCSHGCTVGALDQEPLFYLRSRGLSEQQARALLLNAVASKVIETVSLEPVRLHLQAHVDEWLAANAGEILG